MKKLLSMILIAVLALSLLPAAALAAEPPVEVTPDYAWYGTGEAVEYTLSDVEDLFGFADIVNGKAEGIEKDTFAGEIVRLAADIDLTGMVWTPIGSSMYSHGASDAATKRFEGTFDGQNHTVTGLSSDGYVVLDEDFGGEHSYGLFGYGYGANIRNVKLENVDIECTGLSLESGGTADGSGVAALVGYYVPKDNVASVIENCHVLSGSVTASNNMGGLIGFMHVSNDHYPNSSSITVNVTIKNCSNAAAVTTRMRDAGGMLGLLENVKGHDGSITFENCSNSGAVTAEDYAAPSVAGGILGRDHSNAVNGRFLIVFDGCSNSGTITAKAQRGAEVHAAGMGTAYYTQGSWFVARNCSNTGNISITCENPGQKESENKYAGGIFALSTYTTVEGTCTTTKTVSVLGNTSASLMGALWGGGILCMDSSRDIACEKGNSGSIYLLSGGVALPPARRVSMADDIYAPSDPTRENFTFGGWYKTEGLEYQTPDYVGAATNEFPSGNTYHAKWIPVAPTVMISGATEDKITLTATHPVDGVSYTWYKNGKLISGETGSTLTVESPAESVTYTAKATKDEVDSDFSNSIIVYDEVKAAMKAATEALVVGEYSGTYDGETHNITVSCGENAIAYYKDAGCSIVADGFKDAGTYPVYYKISVPVGNETYYLGGSATVTIAKAKVTVTADNKTAEVGEDQPALTYTTVGFVGEDTFIAEPTCIAVDVDMESAGSYAITVSGGTVGSNYEVEYVSGTLTVTNPPVPMPVYTARVPAGMSISPANPAPGANVTVTLEDATADGVRVVDAKGNPVRVSLKDGVFSFVMPYGDVDIVPLEVPFTDVAETDYFAEAMLWAIANDITKGTGETTFSPAAPCTRAELVTFLWRAAGCPAPAAAQSGFTDVAADAYYAEAVLWAMENGITEGTGEGGFAPDAVCDRAQMAVFLQRMAKGTAVSEENSFADVAADAYYANAVQWALEQGITAGTGEGTYSPNAVCTRAQSLTLLWRSFVK